MKYIYSKILKSINKILIAYKTLSSTILLYSNDLKKLFNLEIMILNYDQ